MMKQIKKREKGQPSKKMKRAQKKLEIRYSMWQTGINASSDGGKGLTKPGSMKMY